MYQNFPAAGAGQHLAIAPTDDNSWNHQTINPTLTSQYVNAWKNPNTVGTTSFNFWKVQANSSAPVLLGTFNLAANGVLTFHTNSVVAPRRRPDHLHYPGRQHFDRLLHHDQRLFHLQTVLYQCHWAEGGYHLVGDFCHHGHWRRLGKIHSGYYHRHQPLLPRERAIAKQDCNSSTVPKNWPIRNESANLFCGDLKNAD